MDQGIAKLADELHHRLFQKPGKTWSILEGPVPHSFHYRMNERCRDRVKSTLHAAVEPNEVIRMKPTLPVWLSSLYFIVRLLRLIGMYERRLLQVH
jgi:hypothetical protein